jgi:AraC family transcriptional regulator
MAIASTPRNTHTVFSTLSTASAHLERSALLGDDLAVAIWRRDVDEEVTVYDKPGHHTLSCYLDGGFRTERREAPGLSGAPKLLCTLPDMHESRWQVRDQLRFLHVYFLPEHFSRRAVVELDREPRELTLPDRTYFEQERVFALCQALVAMSWDRADGLLRANQTTHELLSQLLRSCAGVRRDLKLKGGLAPAVRRRVLEYIDSNLAQPLTVGRLAQVGCLSEYHMARMFRISCGMPPHAWVAERRLDRARQLLRETDEPMKDIVEACGFADLSHLSHRFRAAMGMSPSCFRRIYRRSSPSSPC